MLLAKKNAKDESARIEAHRHKILTYKKFFNTDEGREVLVDLIDRFSLVFDMKTSTLSSDRILGRNDVIAYILNQTEKPMEQWDKIVKGDKT